MSEPIDLDLEQFYRESVIVAITKTVSLVTLLEQVTHDCPLCGGQQLGNSGIRLKHKKDCPIMETLRSVVDIHETLTMRASKSDNDEDHFVFSPNQVIPTR